MKKSIIIIDDHALIRDAWTIILQSSQKYEIIDKIGSSTGIEEIIRTKKPDLVLLDINMVPLDGFEVLKIIRKFSPGTKVIGVSMHSQPAYVKKMIRNGAKGYVTKNSSGNELLTAVDAVMNGGTYICSEVKDIMTRQLIDSEGSQGLEKLTGREMELIKYLRDGFSSKEIGDKMSITHKTVEVHRHNIFKKLGVKNAVALVELINSYGL